MPPCFISRYNNMKQSGKIQESIFILHAMLHDTSLNRDVQAVVCCSQITVYLRKVVLIERSDGGPRVGGPRAGGPLPASRRRRASSSRS